MLRISFIYVFLHDLSRVNFCKQVLSSLNKYNFVVQIRSYLLESSKYGFRGQKCLISPVRSLQLMGLSRFYYFAWPHMSKYAWEGEKTRVLLNPRMCRSKTYDTLGAETEATNSLDAIKWRAKMSYNLWGWGCNLFLLTFFSQNLFLLFTSITIKYSV